MTAKPSSTAAYLLVAPAALLVTAFVLVPLVIVLVVSMFDVSLLKSSAEFVGLGNFQTELTSAAFHNALGNTLAYTAMLVPASMVLGLIAALLINGLSHGQTFWRAAYFLPYAATLVAMASVWRWLFARDVGIIDAIFGPLLGVSGWLNDQALALPAVAIVGIWHQIGFVTILYLAALGTIGGDQVDSAMIDGANGWQRFWHVTWPGLGPTTVFVFVMCVASALQAYDTIVALTGGGPVGATETLTHQIWTRGISYFDVGRASVLSLVLFVLSMAITVLQRRGAGRRLEMAGTR